MIKMKLDDVSSKIEPIELEVKKIKEKLPKINYENDLNQKRIDSYL